MSDEPVLTIKQIDNILAAYNALANKNPLFGFNEETRGVIEALRKLRSYHARPADEVNGPETICILFDGPPGPEAGRFVEVETPEGKSIKVGEWRDRGDGYWSLDIPGALGARFHGPPPTFNMNTKAGRLAFTRAKLARVKLWTPVAANYPTSAGQVFITDCCHRSIYGRDADLGVDRETKMPVSRCRGGKCEAVEAVPKAAVKAVRKGRPRK